MFKTGKKKSLIILGQHDKWCYQYSLATMGCTVQRKKYNDKYDT